MKNLFSPCTIGSLELKNRIVFLSMHLGYTEDGQVTDKLVNFYEKRARGGAGLIIAGGAYVHHLGRGGMGFMSIDHDDCIPGLKALNDAMQAGGAKTAIQLFHSGRYAFSMVIGEAPVSASEVPSPLSGDTPRALSIDEIQEIVGHFTAAAQRAKAAGFDAVEISGSTGYLINQFLSPFTNRRTDEYGGSLENRLRLAAQVIQGIKQALGKDYPVIFRHTFDDLVKGGIGLPETRDIAVGLEEAGADAIDMQVGWHESKVPTSAMIVPRAAFAYLARNITKAVTVPVVVTNRINDPVLADQLLKDGTADLIGMGRSLIADAELPNKAQNNRVGEVRPCIACNQGCMDAIFSGSPVGCLVNPSAGREAEYDIKPAEAAKKVMVVGAGPAGLEAARVLSERGHEVTLYEKENQLGGQLTICGVAPDRKEFQFYLDYLVSEVYRLGVKVTTNAAVTEKMILQSDADVVILATGARHTLPGIPGIQKPHVYSAVSVLKKEAELGHQVVIVGGGHIGCEVALYAAQKSHIPPEAAQFLAANNALGFDDAMAMNQQARSVTIIEERNQIAPYYGRTSKWPIMLGLRQKNVKLKTGTKCVEIHEDRVTVEHEDGEKAIEADTVVITSGYTEEKQLYRQLKEKVPALFVIGDAKKLRSCLAAVHEAADIARRI